CSDRGGSATGSVAGPERVSRALVVTCSVILWSVIAHHEQVPTPCRLARWTPGARGAVRSVHSLHPPSVPGRAWLPIRDRHDDRRGSHAVARHLRRLSLGKYVFRAQRIRAVSDGVRPRKYTQDVSAVRDQSRVSDLPRLLLRRARHGPPAAF